MQIHCAQLEAKVESTARTLTAKYEGLTERMRSLSEGFQSVAEEFKSTVSALNDRLQGFGGEDMQGVGDASAVKQLVASEIREVLEPCMQQHTAQHVIGMQKSHEEMSQGLLQTLSKM
eukprot:9578598-Karenia_brevis.AAC.1